MPQARGIWGQTVSQTRLNLLGGFNPRQLGAWSVTSGLVRQKFRTRIELL